MLLADQMRGKEKSTVHLTLSEGDESGYKPFSESFPNHFGGQSSTREILKGQA
jgi:hypothetical protein